MKKISITLLLFTSLLACQPEAPEPTQPDFEDWYALTAPEARDIKGVYGDIDATLIITTGPRIYLTKDKGKTWIKADYKESNGLFSITSRKDTLFALTTQRNSILTKAYASGPQYFSVDQGISWQLYRCISSESCTLEIPLSQLSSASGTEYSLDVLLTPMLPGSSAPNWVETVGVKTSTGSKISLPANHQINSLYFDQKSRLYVAASAPVCGRLDRFSFCGEMNGVLYVSKKPQP
jgi:hypothetical protein